MSFSLDFSGVWTQASDFINNLWPVFVVPLGLILGAAVMSTIVKQIKKALPG